MQKILALIPARGGSKRLPGKNIRPLGDKPLIAWTISAALQSRAFTDVLVTTDDLEIAEVGRAWGGYVPWLRPAELATDAAGSVEVALHAMDWYEQHHGKVDGLMLLQPTSPFRKVETIHRAMAEFASRGLQTLVSVSPASPHPAWCFHTDGGALVPLLGWEELHRRSQDLRPAYALNGVIYVTTPASLRASHSFLNQDTQMMRIDDPVEILDIDTHFDWLMAEFFRQQMFPAAEGKV